MGILFAYHDGKCETTEQNHKDPANVLDTQGVRLRVLAFVLHKKVFILLCAADYTCTSNFFLRGIFEDFFFFYVRYSTLFHLPPLGFHCVGGCWDRTQDSYDYDIGCQTLQPLLG